VFSYEVNNGRTVDNQYRRRYNELRRIKANHAFDPSAMVSSLFVTLCCLQTDSKYSTPTAVWVMFFFCEFPQQALKITIFCSCLYYPAFPIRTNQIVKDGE
jgi:hypothetical protein